MKILVLGVNHKTAPVALREKVAFSSETSPRILKLILEDTETTEAVILSTCNRTEIYCDTEEAEKIIALLLEQTSISKEELQASLYRHEGQAAIEHIMQVAAGLDSMVIGEPQILGQLKEAVALSLAHQAMGPRFHPLFQAVFRVAKRIRSTTEIGLCPVSVAAIAVRLAKKLFPNLENSPVVLLGAGETMNLVAKYFHQNQVKHLTIVSRRLERAQALAEKFQARAFALPNLASALTEADLLMSATESTLPLVGKGLIERVQKDRNYRPLLLIDLAVPRDIEAEVAEIPGVTLCTLDDLKEISEGHHHARGHAREQALQAISIEAARYLQWLKTLDSTASIRTFRNYVHHLREKELAAAQKLLAQGKPPGEVLEKLAHRLTHKILHQPTQRLRQAGSAGESEFLASIEALFRN